MKKFRLWWDSNTCLPDTSWTKLTTELRSHKLRTGRISEGFSFPRRNLIISFTELNFIWPAHDNQEKQWSLLVSLNLKAITEKKPDAVIFISFKIIKWRWSVICCSDCTLLIVLLKKKQTNKTKESMIKSYKTVPFKPNSYFLYTWPVFFLWMNSCTQNWMVIFALIL